LQGMVLSTFGVKGTEREGALPMSCLKNDAGQKRGEVKMEDFAKWIGKHA